MRTCVIYSGAARTVGELHENHWWFLLRKLPNPTIFASVEDDERADDMLCLQRPGVEFVMEKVVQPDIAVPQQRPHHFGYPVSSSRGGLGVIRQIWALNRAWEFVGGRVNEFDLFVRIRPDIRFCRFVMPDIHASLVRASVRKAMLKIRSETGAPVNLGPPEPPIEEMCLTPWQATWGGINDRLALMGRKAAEAYFTAFTQLPRLLNVDDKAQCPVHTETMMGAALEFAGITPSMTLNTEFILLRPDGKWQQETISISDVANYARTRP